jgi:ferredoxin
MDPLTNARARREGPAYDVTVLETGGHFPCRRDESVLEAMFRARSEPVRCGCCGGGCGVCRMKVVSGSYSAFKAMSSAHVSEADIQSGIVLICCVRPLSDLTITR